MATIKLFKGGDESGFDINKEYLSVDELLPKQPKDDSSSSSSFSSSSTSSVENIFALIEFERAIFFSPSALLIGSKLDLDPNVHTNTCRLAFYGHVVQTIEDANYQLNFIPQLKIYKLKSRTGVVERVSGESELIEPIILNNIKYCFIYSIISSIHRW